MAKKFDFLSPGISLREVDQSFIPTGRDAEGPIIIGRTRRGPANKPVKIKNLDDFIAVFGLPVPGGTGDAADVWREGNTTGPTYASYAAQAWLASEESPVVIVRLAGEQHPISATGTKAGWHLGAGTGVDTTIGDNSSAYGLFLINSGSQSEVLSAAVDLASAAAGGVGKQNLGTGSLAAIIYAQQGEILLKGDNIDLKHGIGTGVGGGAGTSLASAAHYIQSSGDSRQFTLQFKNSSGTVVETADINFDRNSSKYIRNVLNTNPQLANNATDSTIASDDQKTYWLGESYARMVTDHVTSASAGEVFGVLLPLEQQTNNYNWSDRNESAAEAETGWIFSQKATNQVNLFRFKCLHVGDEIQRNYMIAIEDIREPANSTVGSYGSFTVAVKSLSGLTVEKYSNLNLNPSSPNYIGKRIGDQYMTWDETNRRYRTYGDFQNLSDYIYVVINPNIADGGGGGLLPAGFYGPVRPNGFTLLSGSNTAQPLGSVGTAANTTAWIKGGGTAPTTTVNASDFVGGISNQFTASYVFPAIPVRLSGSDGGAPDPFRCYWGIRPKISSTSNVNDPDYCDYLRRLPAAASSYNFAGPGAGYEHSIVFSLDDISASTNANETGYVSGSHEGGTSYSAVNSFGELLDINIKQFLMPLWGGSDGFDIKEKEPMGNHLMGATPADSSNYVHYTINKAIDSIRDPEVVPGNLLLAPGFYKPIVTNKLIQVAEARQDVLAVVDLEGDYKPTTESGDSAASRLGSVTSVVSSLKSRNLNSSFACAFYPWVQISDNLSGGPYVWVPPSVAALGAFGRSQAMSAPWFAPAGFNRGGIGSLGGPRGPSVIQARQRLDTNERDKLYEMNINPIATFPAEGVVIFGQKTLQAGQSALDRINVRRLLLYLKSRVATVSRNLLFDPNLKTTWNRFKGQVEPMLSDVKSRFGLSDYKVVLDESTTTADLIDRNVMYAKIYIKPARAIEFIVVDFIITKTGADFV
jgi:hypothetical protein